MASKLLAGASLAVVIVVFVALVVTVATIGGLLWFFIDDDPLLYYDARPATVDGGTLEATGYERVNDTAFETEWNPIPMGKGIAVRTWSTLYVKPPPGYAGDDGGSGPGTVNGSFDPANVSMVALFSTSSLELGPVAFQPLVYASDPGLLDASGALIDRFETWLPSEVSEVTGVDVESSREATMLGTDTNITTFTGELVLDSRDTAGPGTVEVRMYLARAVVDGELVIALGVGPPNEQTTDEFETLVDGVEMGEWGAEPGTGATELGDRGDESPGRPAVAS